MKNINKILISTLFLYSCAKIGVISGGDKDETRPKLIGVYPDSGTVNFKDKQVFFEFDEFISVDNPTKTIKIIPRLSIEPKIVTKKNIVQLSNLKLEPETTYTIILSKAIKDITEKNVSEKFTMQFSTGPYLDTLKIQGRVVDIEGQGIENIQVYVLHNDDSLSTQTLVNESLTESEGEFTITGLKSGNYKLVALEDKNNNVLYDLPKERIGFTDELELLDTSNMYINMILFATDERKLELLTVRERKDYTEFVANKNVSKVATDSMHFHMVDKNKPSTIKIYPLYGEKINNIKISITDSLQNSLDSQYIRIQPIESIETQDTLVYTSIAIIRKKEYLMLRLETTFPLDIKKSAVSIRSKSLNLDSFPCKLSHGGLSIANCMITFTGALEYDTIDLQIKGQIFDLRGNMYRDTSLTVGQKELAQYGSINIIYPTIDGLSLIPFLSTKNNNFMYSDTMNDTTALFSGLNSGEYSIKLMIDQNGDRMLNPGSYFNRIQPELVYVYPEIVKLKANWDVDKIRIPVNSVLKHMENMKQIGKPIDKNEIDIDNSKIKNKK